MMHRASRLRRLMSAAVLLSSQADGAMAQSECREPSFPAQARIEMIAPAIHANGVSQSLRALHAPLSVEELLTHFRALWAPLATGKRPGSMEHRVDDWRVISTVQGNCFTTVQVKAEGKGSHALVTVSRKPDGQRLSSAGLEFPMLPGSRILSDLGYADGVRNARTVVVTNSARLSTNVEYYLSTLQKTGWTVLMQNQPRTPNGKSGHVLVLKKGVEEMSLVLSTDSGGLVTVVAHRVDRP